MTSRVRLRGILAIGGFSLMLSGCYYPAATPYSAGPVYSQGYVSGAAPVYETPGYYTPDGYPPDYYGGYIGGYPEVYLGGGYGWDHRYHHDDHGDRGDPRGYGRYQARGQNGPLFPNGGPGQGNRPAGFNGGARGPAGFAPRSMAAPATAPHPSSSGGRGNGGTTGPRGQILH